MKKLKKSLEILLGVSLGFVLGWIILTSESNLREIWEGFLDALL